MMDQDHWRRMATFATFPKTSPVSILKLVAAAFVYTGKDDQVTCPACHVIIGGWKKTDIPLDEHHRRSPACGCLAQLPPPSQLSNKSFPNSASNYASENVEIITEPQQLSCIEVEQLNQCEPVNVRLNVKSKIDRSNPDFDSLKQEKIRLETYFDWPQSSKLTPPDLAKEGFFYIGERDKVQCVFCRGVLFNWLEGDRPQVEHRKHFPNCHFVRGRNVGNVTLKVYEDPEQTIRNPSSSSTRASESAAGDVQNVDGSVIQANPAIVATTECTSQSRPSNESLIGRALDGIPARAVLSMGYSKQVVQQAISNQIAYQRANFESAEELLESIMSLGIESHDPLMPVTPNISASASATPNLMSSSDEDLSFELTSRINEEHNEPVEITAENCHDQSTLRLNEEQLENLQRTVEMSSAAESGALRKKEKKRKRKTKKATENQNSKELDIESGKEPSKSKELKTKQQIHQSGASEISETNDEDLQLMEENKTLREARTCKVCMDKDVNTVFLPCGHLVCCNDCAANIHNCAICRTLIRGTVKIFLS